MLARLPEVEALLQRALVLDESWNAGALHEFAVTWYAVRPGRADRRAAERHYERALALSGGRRAGLYVAYAEAVAVPAQNRGQFTALLERALAVPADADPNGRLLNALAQSRASWLLSRADYLFAE
jgi:predicted anti-sigma-YlaC factor YlaD